MDRPFESSRSSVRLRLAQPSSLHGSRRRYPLIKDIALSSFVWKNSGRPALHGWIDKPTIHGMGEQC
jgi:hypothetical protein